MLRIEVLPWNEARALAVPIRFSVFVEEQGVPREMELDQADADSIHAVAFDDAEAVGTGRLLPDGHIGRMAVLKAWRGRGIGGQILHRLMDRARERGDREVVLAAQVSASAFYRAHGFAEEGPEYLEAGIRHRDMRRRF
ncbi:MAG TPA: GNAT family N-acetyltransferase [Burkholderiales bacterium]|nr:GNAT family N-acetyltransferase [Burkholderiales bacterium]